MFSLAALRTASDNTSAFFFNPFDLQSVLEQTLSLNSQILIESKREDSATQLMIPITSVLSPPLHWRIQLVATINLGNFLSDDIS